MICVLAQQGAPQGFSFENKIAAIMNVCDKKRIPFKRVTSLDAAQELRVEDEVISIVVMGFSSRWIFSIVEKARSLGGFKVIVAGNHSIPSYMGLFSGVSYDMSMALTDVFTYLDNHKKTNVAVYGISPSVEEEVAAANLTVKFMPWRRCDGEQVFPLYTTLSDCWQSFSVSMGNFDAVICPNDLVAISLMQHIKAYRPSKLHDIFIVSLQEAVLGKIYSPGVTTLSCDIKRFAEEILQIHSSPNSAACQVFLNRTLNVGASTGNQPVIQPSRLFSYSEMVSENIIAFDSPVIQVAPDTEYIEVQKLNKLFTGCNDYELGLLIILLERENYNDMANIMGTNPETVKYYIRKCFMRAGLKNKVELKNILEKYLTARDLRRYRIACGGSNSRKSR